MANDFLTLQTTLPPEALREKLQRWEPWSMRLDFSNGVSTRDFKRRIPFNEYPLKKFNVVSGAIPFRQLAGGKLLDIGCNAGYNSIHAAAKYGLMPTGIDAVPRHIEVARFLSEVAAVNARFCLGSAEAFLEPQQFDVVLHFGTLYHLPNPILSLQVSFDNLRPGGHLALETQVYDRPGEPNSCYFMRMQNNDPTNFWALSTKVLKECLELVGFREVREVVKVVPPHRLAPHMSRIMLVARKPASITEEASNSRAKPRSKNAPKWKAQNARQLEALQVPMLAGKTSLYVANGRTARANFAHNPCARWYKKGATADDTSGTLAFQRLRQQFFTPSIKPAFELQRDDKIFAIGSCFARTIEQALMARKMEVLSAAPEFASLETVNKDVTGLGFTNKYNTYSIYNELRWALDPQAQFPRESIVDVPNGFVVDPHINPTLPLAGAEETWRRRELIQMVNRRAAQCRVIFVTLGLVEVWRDIETDTFLNSTPFFNLLELYPERYEVHVTDFAQNVANLERIHDLLSRFGHPDVQIIVTVSPVPLMATFAGDDIVLANTYSKSLLRAVAQHWSAAHENVHYFPSYEIVMNSDRTTTWDEDLRHVKPAVVKHIMDVFVRCYLC